MKQSKQKIYGVATANITSGKIDFEHMTANRHDLMFMVICFFLKIRWMFADQEEVSDLQNAYNTVIEQYPSSVNNISTDYLSNPELGGETILKLILIKRHEIGIESYFPNHYSNSSIINIAMIFADKVYQVLNPPERELFVKYFAAFQSLVNNDSQDVTPEYLWAMYGCVSAYRKQMYKHLKRNGIIRF